MFFISTVYATNINLQLEISDSDLYQNLYSYISNIDTSDSEIDECLKNRIIYIITKGLRALGYYNPNISFFVRHAFNSLDNDIDTLIIHVDPGIPIRNSSIDIVIRGDALYDDDFSHIILSNTRKIGSILHHSDYDTLKKNLLDISLIKGYFDAEFRSSKLLVSLSNNQAIWNIDFDSGSRYSFGKLNFIDSQICEKYLRNISSVYENNLYHSDILNNLNNDLMATNWFNSVMISPNFTEYNFTDKILPLNIIFSPKKKNSFEIGAGYSTEIGCRLRVTWKKPWLNSGGHSLESKLSLSIFEQIYNINYKIPLLKNPLREYYLIQGSFRHKNVYSNKFNSSTISIMRCWYFSKNWCNTINLHGSLENFIHNNVSNNIKIIYPGIYINHVNLYNELIPSCRNSQYYTLNISNKIWCSDVNFFIVQAQNKYVKYLSDQHFLMLHSNLCWVKSDNFMSVFPIMRFFVIHDLGIRGYKFDYRSFCNNLNKFIGVSKLIRVSLENHYNLFNKWWSVVFFDAGEFIHSTKRNYIKFGTGIGLRYLLPVGSIKIDLAFPIFKQEENEFKFYFSLSPGL